MERIFLHDSQSAVKILLYLLGLLRFFVGIGISGYLPPLVTIPTEIGEVLVLRTWGILWQRNGAGSPDLLLLSCIQRESW